MRASYVNPDDLLTPCGKWIADRLPHVQVERDHWHRGARVVRVYGGRPLYRLCLFDYTKARFYAGKPSWVRVRVMGLTIYERNSHLSGC